ncbi:centrosomal protein CEP57L1 isoform X2 [Anguilla rostrata]|uniref:centrosomal protein CEP57L1 isoform X2 n=1 Tax=Anguilla rostrata TaxID=7938 RepID=UPI0030D1B68E
MEPLQDQNVSVGSPFKNSYFGSFHLPPERMSPSIVKDVPAAPVTNNVNLQEFNIHMYRASPDAGSKAVIAALKTLQEKMRRLELERVQAERNVNQLCRLADRDAGRTAQREPGGRDAGGREGRPHQELAVQLQSAEARCSLLEKQLDYMRKMVEKAEQDRNAVVQKQESLHKDSRKDQTEVEVQLQKLEMLERECLKLSSTQSVAERKIELLEQKLQREEHERKLVQEKAAELQRSLEKNHALYSSVSAGVKPKRKTKKPLPRKTAAVAPLPHPFPKAKQMPFVAGTSTGPSHSVSANVQSVLHMLKHHHHPHLCDRAHPLRRSGSETRGGPRRAPSGSKGAPVLGNLSEVLLALQDELGQMSFEHQELAQQIEDTQKRGLREDLERELDCLVKRMEEKGAQISQLKKHQLAKLKLKRRSGAPKPRAASADGRIGPPGGGATSSRPASPAPRTTTPRRPRGGKGGSGGCQGNRSERPQLKGPVRLQTNLQKDDIICET